MYNPNTIPYLNREIRRKVERYRRSCKDKRLTFTQAYNKLFHTKYSEPITTSTQQEPGNNKEKQ